MGRGIVKLNPKKLLRDLGLVGYDVVGSRMHEGRIDLVVKSDKIKVAHDKLAEVEIPKRRAVENTEAQTQE